MSLFSKFSDSLSNRFTADQAAHRLAEKLRAKGQDLPIEYSIDGPGLRYTALPGRWTVVIDDCKEGARAEVREPGKPGRDPVWILKAIYDVTSLVEELLWRAKMPQDKLTVHLLRADAVYEVTATFKDHYGNTFEAGTRLTYVQYHFLPYEGGYTVLFREATVYLQEESVVYNALQNYLRFADRQ